MAGEKNTLYLSGGDMGHSYMVGTTAMGKSRIVDQFIKEEAARRGIPVEDLILEMASKLDSQEPLSIHFKQEEQKKVSDKRLDAVKAAYWEATPEDETLDMVDTLLQLMPDVDNITMEQKKAVFMMLPSSVIGLIVKWGMDDTEARDQIYEFVESHIGDVRAAMGLQP
ncbi:hypothetical protein ACTG16_23305 [Aeromonas sp. 23P]|uniref:hypothetical protein n=1 Tax=Aeromonas sp. 23P TaxID=3452716 RepID=UPI003F793840